MVVRWNCPGLVEALAAGESRSPGSSMEEVHWSVPQHGRDAADDKPETLDGLRMDGAGTDVNNCSAALNASLDESAGHPDGGWRWVQIPKEGRGDPHPDPGNGAPGRGRKDGERGAPTV